MRGNLSIQSTGRHLCSVFFYIGCFGVLMAFDLILASVVFMVDVCEIFCLADLRVQDALCFPSKRGSFPNQFSGLFFDNACDMVVRAFRVVIAGTGIFCKAELESET
jgi:hypothetical protein